MDFLRELGLYDIVGHFIPGALLLFVVIACFFQQSLKKRGGASYVLLFVLGAYITGHMVQAVASQVGAAAGGDRRAVPPKPGRRWRRARPTKPGLRCTTGHQAGRPEKCRRMTRRPYAARPDRH